MAQPRKKTYTKPIPPDAERITLDIRKKGKRAQVPGVKFRGPGGALVKAPLTASGDRVLMESESYYGTVTMADGTRKPVPLCEDKTASEGMLRDLQMKQDRGKALGLSPQAIEAPTRPIGDWVEEFAHAVTSGSRRKKRKSQARPSGEHVEKTISRVRAVIQGCQFTTAAEITIGTVEAFLASLQADSSPPALPLGSPSTRPAREGFRSCDLAALLRITPPAVAALARRHGLTFTGNGKARRISRSDAEELLRLATRGMSERTASYYAREVKSFTAWLTKQGVLSRDPLAELAGATSQNSHRHERRALEEEEVQRLLDTTRMSKRTLRGLTGESRYYLYLTALSTGFRAGELASLTLASFRLDGAHPLVLLSKTASKNGEGAEQPLPTSVVPLLRPWLASKGRGPVWPGSWHEDGADLLRIDCEAARIPTVVPGPDGDLFVDFHGLRHSFVARLDRAGVPLKVASELARHSTVELTAKIYARPRLKDLAGMVDRLGSGSIPEPAGKNSASRPAESP